MTTVTTFSNIKIGSAFRQSGDTRVYVRVDCAHMTGDARFCNAVNTDTMVYSRVGSETQVTPARYGGEMGQCCVCGETYPVVALIEQDENYYDWDDPDGGSFLLHRTTRLCQDSAACRQRRAAAARLAGDMARADDGSASERGWGVIGGPARGE